jgi:hypothetical protein
LATIAQRASLRPKHLLSRAMLSFKNLSFGPSMQERTQVPAPPIAGERQIASTSGQSLSIMQGAEQ